MSTRTLDESEYRALCALAVVGTAANILSDTWRASAARVGAAHPGDLFGNIITPLFHRNPDAACLMTADLLAEIREHHKGGTPEPGERVTLDELLKGIRLAWLPQDKESFQRFAVMARDEVPKYYGQPLHELNER